MLENSQTDVRTSFVRRPKTQLNVFMFDKIIFFFIMLLGVIPFGAVFNVSTGFAIFNAFEILYLLLIVTLFIRIAIFRISLNIFPFIIFLGILTLYGTFAIAMYWERVDYVIFQVRTLLPYLVATLLLMTRFFLPLKYVLMGLAVAALISATFALYLHLFNQNYLQDVLGANEEIVSLSKFGRMYWLNASLAFFSVIAYITIDKTKFYQRIILLLSSLVSFVAMFNTLNRTMLLGLITFVVTISLYYGYFNKPNGSFVKTISLILVSALGIYFIINFEERLERLIAIRFFGNGGGFLAIYQQDLLNTRSILYHQYWNSLLNYFPFGQGLGVPLSVYLLKEAYITDISLLTFTLPFGFLGLLCFIIFLVSIFKTIKKISNKYYLLKRSLFILYFLSILMSFNIDLYSRNNFVIFFVAVILSASNNKLLVMREDN